ncbi:autotransporter domain-containing protein [Jinshanibacter sp. LJY008]|uniref:Autotransporter domain-containing protein n=1 Tax=Limnobaculum eriocheiris TaxID=2897391 RepID=A0A9X1SKM3_9GAMM|nr:autotransporter domain-containing protein [Limnobaculum eriocheiris]MCD1126648.1 autotransporter domain-containing protein [Limnobaculum eriocheiris]
MKHKPTNKPYLFKRKIILISLLSGIMTAQTQAQEAIWNNNTGNSLFFDGLNWSTGLGPMDNDDALYIKNSNGQEVKLIINDFNELSGSADIVIGQGENNNSYVKVSGPPEEARSSFYNGKMTIGSDGATGLFEYQHGTIDQSSKFASIDTLNIGSGLNSNGTMSLFGVGKNTTDQFMGKSIVGTQNAHIGIDGGTGELTVSGSEFEVNSYYTNSDPVTFTLGDGSNSGISSKGTMNILAGGKGSFSAGHGLSSYDQPTSIIGLNQGEGTLNISGSTVINGEVRQSRSYFAQGLAIGQDTGSIGTVNITDGGSMATMSATEDTTNIGAYVGVNGGKGSVLISGTDSVWNVSGHTYYGDTSGEVGNLSIGESGTGIVTIANGGKISLGRTDYHHHSAPTYYSDFTFYNDQLGELHLGNQADGVGQLNFGAAEGQPAQAPGTLEADKIIFGAGEGTVVFNHTDNSGQYIFATTMVSSAEGQGTIKQVNGVTVFNTNLSTFTGKTEVTGGTLVVNNVLGGAMSVSGGGTLTGTGSIGNTTIGNGGTLSPGEFNSTEPATITINGNLIMESGSNYIVDITTNSALPNPYVSDLIQVNGSTVLNGAAVTVRDRGDSALYVPGSRWHILSASGGVTGEFAAITPLLYVNANYEYDANNAYLTITRNQQDICTANMSSNECNAAESIIEQTVDIHNEIISQPDEKSAKNALSQLSGEIHASAKSALLEDSRFIREAVNNRLQDPAVGDGAWGHIYASWGKFDSSNDTADMRRNIAGVFLGVDKSLNDTWKMGLVGGYGKADITVSDRSSSADRYDYQIGAYTKGQWDNFNLHTGVSYALNDYSTKRKVRLQSIHDDLSADYNASTSQVFTEARYLFNITQTLSVEPYADAAYVHIKTDDFTENGGNARLHGAADSTNTFFTTLGSRVTKHFTLENGQTTKIWGNAGWRHAYNDVTPTEKVNFVGANSFSVEGASISKDVAVFEAGAEIKVTLSTEVGAMYNGQVGNNTQDHGAKVYINWRF